MTGIPVPSFVGHAGTPAKSGRYRFMPSDRANKAFIVTLKRSPDAAPEDYYILGVTSEQAQRRALRLAMAARAEILDVVAA